MTRPLIRCACCDRLGPHKAHGWISACYRRWLDHGKPPGGPPAPYQHHQQPRPYDVYADYVHLRSLGYSRAEAAARLGVSRRTIQRYDRRREREEHRALR